MLGMVVLGFLMGMSHALEADHVAAMAAMSRDRSGGIGGGGGLQRMLLRGAFWGVGHTIILFAFGIFVVVFGFVVTAAGAARLEFAVGVMLIVLGLHVFYRVVRYRVHFHVHSHADGEVHLHAHSHDGEEVSHRASLHEHAHPGGLPWSALLVGLVHGAAGSAGLLTLAIASTQDAVIALGYILVFGVGSICGMVLLSSAVAWPLLTAERSARVVHVGVTIAAGVLAVGIGINVMVGAAGPAWGGV